MEPAHRQRLNLRDDIHPSTAQRFWPNEDGALFWRVMRAWCVLLALVATALSPACAMRTPCLVAARARLVIARAGRPRGLLFEARESGFPRGPFLRFFLHLEP